MTVGSEGAIVEKAKKGPWVRKGKAMLQIHTDNYKNTYRLFDLQGKIMPTAEKAEWLICLCLNRTGPSEYLESKGSP